MKPKILYIVSSFNLYGGTPKKTLDLMSFFKESSSIYVYHNTFSELKAQFEMTGGQAFEGFFGYNLIKHIKRLLQVIKDEKIKIIHTQFFFGELLGFILKIFRPELKLIIGFEGSFNPRGYKFLFSKLFYRNVDYFIFISKYVKNEKLKKFKILKKKPSSIIYNGSYKMNYSTENYAKLKSKTILCVSSLDVFKNIQILIKAMNILVNRQQLNNIFLYVAGEGKYRKQLEILIKSYALSSNMFLLGKMNNVGALLEETDIFVHPCYKEGFGIAVAEAMHARKPIIVANAGALPELVEHNVSGLVIDPYDANKWAEAVIQLLDNKEFAEKIASNALKSAEENFSISKFCRSYHDVYLSLFDTNKI